VDDESSLSGTSVGVDATSGHLAVRVLCNLMVGGPYSAVTVRWGGRLANALWTDPERPRDRCQRWNDASRRNALHTPSREPDVAGCDVENAAATFGRPSAAGTL
jgi:hypothetical protein